MCVSSHYSYILRRFMIFGNSRILIFCVGVCVCVCKCVFRSISKHSNQHSQFIMNIYSIKLSKNQENTVNNLIFIPISNVWFLFLCVKLQKMRYFYSFLFSVSVLLNFFGLSSFACFVFCWLTK